MIFELSGSQLRVMGTLHLLPPGRNLPPWVQTAYDWSEAVFVEHSPVEFLRLARQTQTGGAISPAFQALLTSVAAKDRLAWEPGSLRRGAAVVMALGSRVTGIAGADQTLYEWCQRDAKTFGYVEQASGLLDAMDGIPEAEWTSGIQAELQRPEGVAQQLQRFYDAWRKGRLQDIALASAAGLFSRDAIRQTMLVERNAAWAARYVEPQSRSLVAVGAAHLVGPGNFMEQLTRVSGRGVRRIV